MEKLYAYLLGLVLTDGSFDGYRASIGLTRVDREVLERLSSKFGGVVKDYKSNNSSILRLPKDVTLWLVSKGLIRTKSYMRISPPEVEEFEIDYIRGLLDGDGSLYVGRGVRVRFCQSKVNEDMVVDFINKVVRKIGIVGKLVRVKNGMVEAVYTGWDAKRLVEKVYYDGCFGVKRKVEKSKVLISADLRRIDSSKKRLIQGLTVKETQEILGCSNSYAVQLLNKQGRIRKFKRTDSMDLMMKIKLIDRTSVLSIKELHKLVGAPQSTEAFRSWCKRRKVEFKSED